MYEQELYNDNILRVNEQHFAVTFLLDTSGSMCGAPIQSLTDGLNALVHSLKSDSNAEVIDLAVITFGGGVDVVMPFTPVSMAKHFNFPARGDTPMGEALLTAARITNERRRQYNAEGVMAYKPWIFMITDGAPTDSLDAARQELLELQNSEKLKLWVLGIPGYAKEPLKGLTQDDLILELSDFDLETALNWVNKSIASVSHSTPGQKVKSAPLPENMGVRCLDLT